MKQLKYEMTHFEYGKLWSSFIINSDKKREREKGDVKLNRHGCYSIKTIQC